MARAAKNLLPCAVLAVLMLGPSMVQIGRMRWEQHSLDRKLRALQHEQVDRLQLYDRLRHDDVYVEGLIRSTFRQSKPGELVIPTEPSPASRSPRRISE